MLTFNQIHEQSLKITDTKERAKFVADQMNIRTEQHENSKKIQTIQKDLGKNKTTLKERVINYLRLKFNRN